MYGGPSCCFLKWKMRWNCLNCTRNKLKKTQHNLYLQRLPRVESSISYDRTLLRTCDWPIIVLRRQRVYKYIIEVENMLDHRLPTLAWNTKMIRLFGPVCQNCPHERKIYALFHSLMHKTCWFFTLTVFIKSSLIADFHSSACVGFLYLSPGYTSLHTI